MSITITSCTLYQNSCTRVSERRGEQGSACTESVTFTGPAGRVVPSSLAERRNGPKMHTSVHNPCARGSAHITVFSVQSVDERRSLSTCRLWSCSGRWSAEEVDASWSIRREIADGWHILELLNPTSNRQPGPEASPPADREESKCRVCVDMADRRGMGWTRAECACSCMLRTGRSKSEGLEQQSSRE